MLAVLDWSNDLAVESGDTERCESGRIGRSRKPLTGNGPWVRIPPSPPLPRQEQTPLKEGEHGIAPYRENRIRLDSEPTRQKRSTSRPARASRAATQAPAPLLCHSHKTSRLSFPMFPSAIPDANPHACHSRRFRLSFPTPNFTPVIPDVSVCHSRRQPSHLSFPTFPSAIPDANPHTCHSRRF